MANGITLTTRMPYTDTLSHGPYAENNWHFSYNGLIGDAESCAEFARAGVRDFWTEGALPSGSDNLTSYLQATLTGTIEFSWVDWEDSTNTSIDLDPITYTRNTSPANLPNECASCLTFKCDPRPPLKRQSLYNRVYLGPLNVLPNAGTGTTSSRITSTFRDDVIAAYQIMQDTLDVIGIDNAHHAVYSPKDDSSGITTSAYIDNAWDTQRRRGLQPTARSTWTP